MPHSTLPGRQEVRRRSIGSPQECIKSTMGQSILSTGCQCLTHECTGCCLNLVELQVQTTG